MLLRMDYLGYAVVAQPFNPSIWEGEASGSVSWRPSWHTDWVPQQPGLHREALPWKTKQKSSPNSLRTLSLAGQTVYLSPFGFIVIILNCVRSVCWFMQVNAGASNGWRWQVPWSYSWLWATWHSAESSTEQYVLLTSEPSLYPPSLPPVSLRNSLPSKTDIIVSEKRNTSGG